MASISPRRSSSPSSPSQQHSTALARLQTIAKHMASVSITNFPAEVVPQAPEDPLFGLSRAYKADPSPDKIDLVRCSSPGHPFHQQPSSLPTAFLLTPSSPGHWRLSRRQREALDLARGQEGMHVALGLVPCPSFRIRSFSVSLSLSPLPASAIYDLAAMLQIAE